MKPHEIIKSIRDNGTELTHLNTLSVGIDKIATYVGQDADSEDFIDVVFLNRLSKVILNIGQFIAADKDSKPLEEFMSPCAGAQQKACASDAVGGCECYALDRQQQEAQQGVIFEGWEVVNSISIKHTTTGDTLQFFKNGNIYYDRRVRKEEYEGFFLGTNPPIADLAAATTENPLKLKQ